MSVSGDRMEFRKYYAEGNAYVVIESQPGAAATASWIADDTRGLGGDGLIVIEEAPGEAMHHMRVFNADGSEAQWCGNGARAAAALIAERDDLREGEAVTITSGGGTAQHVLLDRETWTFRAEMPVPADPIVEIGEDRRLVQMLIGAPHLVVFGPRPTGEQLDDAGTALCAARPGGTNVMFASRDDDGGLTVTPWERGVGPVMGCATGAAAAAIAAERVLGRPFAGGYVRQPGGAIEVHWDSSARVLEMTGTTRLVAMGAIALDRAERPVAGAPVTG
jgi:diaminopimelate epimerase